MKLVGWPEAITAYEWIVSKATHKLDSNRDYLTSLELENKSPASDQAALLDEEDPPARSTMS
jgi:phage protein D